MESGDGVSFSISSSTFGVDPLSYEAVAPNLKVVRLHTRVSDLLIRPNDVVQLVKVSVPVIDEADELPAPPRRRITGKSCQAASSDPYVLRKLGGL